MSLPKCRKQPPRSMIPPTNAGRQRDGIRNRESRLSRYPTVCLDDPICFTSFDFKPLPARLVAMRLRKVNSNRFLTLQERATNRFLFCSLPAPLALFSCSLGDLKKAELRLLSSRSKIKADFSWS